MRRRPLFWLLISMLCFVGAGLWTARSPKVEGRNPKEIRSPKSEGGQHVDGGGHTNVFSHRLANTTKTVAQLSRSDHAILLEHALFDTETPGAPASLPAIPPQLSPHADPGRYFD